MIDTKSKEYNDFVRELGKIPASRLNDITMVVNTKKPKESIGPMTPVEEMFYSDMIDQANEHVKKYGFWPTFEMAEIESDDPVLDIYGNNTL